MKEINELKQKIATTVKSMRDLNDKALEEKRDFSEEEQTKYDEFKTEREKLESELKRREEQEELNKKLAGFEIRNEDDGEQKDLEQSFSKAVREYVTTGIISNEFRGNAGLVIPTKQLFRADPLLTTTTAGIINKQIAPLSIVTAEGLSFAQQLGVNILNGVTGTVELPNMAQLDASVVSENAQVGSFNASPAVIEMKARTFGATQSYSKQFLKTASPDVINKITGDMMAACERKIVADLFDNFSVDALDASVSSTTTGLSYGDMVNLKAINYALGNTAYVTTPSVRAYLEQLNASSAGIKFAWDNDRVAGARAFATSNANSNEVYFGDWSQATISLWGSPEIVVDGITVSDYAKVKYGAYIFADTAIQNYRAFKWTADVSAGI